MSIVMINIFLVTMMVVWVVVIIMQKHRFDWDTVWTLPLPPVTKLRKFMLDLKLFKIRSNKDKINSLDEIDLMKKIENYQSTVNISVVIEAALESGFQFWFQTVYLMPTIFLTFMDIDEQSNWSDLFTWKVLSILLSFGTFSWTFCSIE